METEGGMPQAVVHVKWRAHHSPGSSALQHRQTHGFPCADARPRFLLDPISPHCRSRRPPGDTVGSSWTLNPALPQLLGRLLAGVALSAAGRRAAALSCQNSAGHAHHYAGQAQRSQSRRAQAPGPAETQVNEANGGRGGSAFKATCRNARPGEGRAWPQSKEGVRQS